MPHKEASKKILAGLFFILGIFLITVFILTLGKDKGLMQPKFKVTVLFKDISGLIEGAPVRLAGVNVGRVADIRFLPKGLGGRRVNVRLSIFKKYRSQLDENAYFTITTEGVLGQKLVKINVFNDGQKLDLKKPIMGQESTEIQDLAEAFTEAAQSFTKTSQDLNQINIKELSEVLSETTRFLSDISKKLNQVLVEVNYIAIKTKRLLDRIEQKVIDGDLFKIF